MTSTSSCGSALVTWSRTLRDFSTGLRRGLTGGLGLALRGGLAGGLARLRRLRGGLACLRLALGGGLA